MIEARRDPLRLKPLTGAASFVHAGLLSLCVGYSTMVVIHHPPLAAMLGGDLLSTAERSELIKSLLFWSTIVVVLMAAGLRWSRHGGRWPATLGELVAALWPLTLLPLALFTFDIQAWSTSPVLLYSLSTAACFFCVYRTEFPKPKMTWSHPQFVSRYGNGIVLGAAITTYVIYVSVHTILNHWSLGTAAYDLGIQENAIWNTLHGDTLYTAIAGGHYLGVHTSFILFPVALVYAFAPATETLLIIQTLVLGLAALPLYLLACVILEKPSQALLIALLWLAHPAVGGANFYDFHPVAFAPLFLFTAVYFWWRERWRPFWISIALLLAVKEEMSIIVALLGLVMMMGGNRRKGIQVAAVGAIAYVVLQHMVIPYFAGGDHSYTWYYTDIIPAGEGPHGLVTTALLNPVFALKFILTQPKALFVFQVFAPLAFLTFLSARGAVLISYGLAAALLASRPSVHEIGFQYALTLLALGFVGALLTLTRLSDRGRSRALTVAVMLAVLTCYHYGMIWPRHNFTGGFHRIDFDYSERDRTRYVELAELIKQIPPDAAVLAGENLVPHVAQRRIVETTRRAHDRKFAHYDAILIFNDGDAQRLRRAPGLNGLRGYEIADQRGDFILFTAKPDENRP